MSALESSLRPAKAWDRWGVVASASCVVHCITTPFVALALPVVAATEGITNGLLGVAIVLFALLAFVPGLRMHGKRQVLLLGATGIALIWTAVLLPQDLVEDGLGEGLTVVGGLVMVAAHIFNIVLCRRCSVCCEACTAGRVASAS